MKEKEGEVNSRKRALAFVVVVAAVLLVANGPCAHAGAAATNSSWVAVSLFDGRMGIAAEYYGRIETKTLAGIVDHSLTNGFFKLESTRWIDNERGLMSMKDEKLHGNSRGYGDTAYFRVELVIRIIPLDSAFVRETLSRDEEEQTPKTEPAGGALRH